MSGDHYLKSPEKSHFIRYFAANFRQRSSMKSQFSVLFTVLKLIVFVQGGSYDAAKEQQYKDRY